jgi:hypothetical protein
MFGFIPPTLRPMAATSILPGNMVIALALAAAAAAVAMAATGILPGDKVMALAFMVTAVAMVTSMFGGGGVGVCDIIA